MTDNVKSDKSQYFEKMLQYCEFCCILVKKEILQPYLPGKRLAGNEGEAFMQCVYIDDRLPNGFEEQFTFSPEMPYTISIKRFLTEDIVPLHYAETIEMLLCDKLCGEIVIDNQHYSLEGQQLFVIPPYTVHSNNIRPGGGTMYVFKICFREMDRYINISNYLAIEGCRLSQLEYFCPEYDKVMEIVEGLVENDGELMKCLPLIVELFLTLSRHVDQERQSSAAHSRFKDSSLQDLIRWTHENYARKITIEEVADMAGYSKYHFCSRFKALTGMTYLNYLNSVRVAKACLMLRNGDAVQTVSRNCGFENTSHFIQIFKRIQHVTPYQYATQQKKLSP